MSILTNASPNRNAGGFQIFQLRWHSKVNQVIYRLSAFCVSAGELLR